jgi:LmbE family N-acetylglucosaminyl deacetylase
MERVLVIAAHPDDIETSAGGTVARLVSSGVEVHYVLVTNGDRGTSNRSMTPEELSIIRQQEQRNAAAILGVSSVDFLNLEDGSVENTETLQLNMTRLIRKYRPHAILTWDPSLAGHDDLYLHGLQHSDHRTTGLVVLDVVYPKIRDFLYFTELLDEGFQPWIVKEVYLFTWEVDLANPASLFQVDITSVFDQKMSSLLEHKSQISNPTALTNTMKTMGASLAQASFPTRPERIYVEWFKRILFM